MYDELVNRLREKASAFDYQGWTETAIDYEQAADALEEIDREYKSISKSLDEAVELIQKKDAKYKELLKAAHSMHKWIFLNSFDEQKAYDECGLTPEMNALLGYGGQFIVQATNSYSLSPDMPKEEGQEKEET